MTLTVNQRINRNPHLHHLLMTKPDNTLQIVSDQLQMTSFGEAYNLGVGFSPARSNVTAETEKFFDSLNLARDTPMLNVLSHLYKRDVPCVSVFNADDRYWAFKSLLAGFVDKRMRNERKNAWTVFIVLFPEDIEYVYKALTADYGLRDAVIKRMDDVDLLDEQCREIAKYCPKDDRIGVLISTFSLFTEALKQPYFGIGLFDSIGVFINNSYCLNRNPPVVTNELKLFKELLVLVQEISPDIRMGILYNDSPLDVDEILDSDHPYNKLPKLYLGTEVGCADQLNLSITHAIRNDLPTGEDILELLSSFPGKSVIYCPDVEVCKELYEEVVRLPPKRPRSSNQIRFVADSTQDDTRRKIEDDFRSGFVETVFTTTGCSYKLAERKSLGLFVCVEFSDDLETYAYQLTYLGPTGLAVLFARPKWLEENAKTVEQLRGMFP